MRSHERAAAIVSMGLGWNSRGVLAGNMEKLEQEKTHFYWRKLMWLQVCVGAALQGLRKQVVGDRTGPEACDSIEGQQVRRARQEEWAGGTKAKREKRAGRAG